MNVFFVDVFYKCDLTLSTCSLEQETVYKTSIRRPASVRNILLNVFIEGLATYEDILWEYFGREEVIHLGKPCQRSKHPAERIYRRIGNLRRYSMRVFRAYMAECGLLDTVMLRNRDNSGSLRASEGISDAI